MKEKTARTWTPRLGLELPDALLPDIRGLFDFWFSALSGVAPANQTKERAKTNSSWISPIFVNSGVFSLGKQARFTYRTFVPECRWEKFMNWPFFGLVCRGHLSNSWVFFVWTLGKEGLRSGDLGDSQGTSQWRLTRSLHYQWLWEGTRHKATSCKVSENLLNGRVSSWQRRLSSVVRVLLNGT